jgi:glycosyltransferase involved in cell wall biosynthesis
MRPRAQPSRDRWRLLVAGPYDPNTAPLVGRLRRRNAFELRTLRLDGAASDPARAFLQRFVTAASLLGQLRDREAALLDAPAADVVRLLPWVSAACRVRRTPLVVRVSEGRLAGELARASSLRRKACARALAGAGLVLLRGRDDVEPLAELGTARWLPAYQDLCADDAPDVDRADGEPKRTGCKRLLVACDALDARDLAGLVAASDALPEDVTLTLAGARDRAPVAQHPRAAWVEVDDARDLERLIEEHDALVEPDPAADDAALERIVRALQAGVPVVAGLGGDVERYVEHGVAGLVVAPRAYGELGRTLTELAGDGTLYARLAHGARLAGARFDARRWDEELEDWLFQVPGTRILSFAVLNMPDLHLL